jgi:hypothetical protein
MNDANLIRLTPKFKPTSLAHSDIRVADWFEYPALLVFFKTAQFF